MLFWGLAEVIFNFFCGAKCRNRTAANEHGFVRGLGKIGGLDQVEYIITNSSIPSGTYRQLEENGIKVIIADKPNR